MNRSTKRLADEIERRDSKIIYDGKYLRSPIYEAGELVTEVNVKKGLWGNEEVIVVGNSGLFFILDEGVYLQHFLPDGYGSPRPDRRIKFTEVYIDALGSFLGWNKANRKISTVYCVTNATYSDFMKGLLGDHYEVLHRYETRDVVRVNVDRLVHDCDVLNRISMLGKRARRAHYQMEEMAL